MATTHMAGSRFSRSAASGRAHRLALQMGVGALAALILTGCQTSQYPEIQQTGSLRAFRAEDRHPIVVEPGEVRLNIELPGFVRDLSPRQMQQVRAFLRDYRSLGEGELVVMVPSGTANEGAAFNTIGEVRSLIKKARIPKTAVRYTPYRGEGKGQEPPIVLSYERYFAHASPCGNWPKNVAHEPYNKPYAEFGCATQNNLAAMVADPRDLIRARPMTPSSAARRSVVLEAYRQGDITASERSAEETAEVSEAAE